MVKGGGVSDFVKSIVVMVLTIIFSHVATVATLSTEIAYINKSIEKLDKNLEKFDERLRKVEQITYVAAND